MARPLLSLIPGEEKRACLEDPEMRNTSPRHLSASSHHFSPRPKFIRSRQGQQQDLSLIMPRCELGGYEGEDTDHFLHAQSLAKNSRSLPAGEIQGPPPTPVFCRPLWLISPVSHSLVIEQKKLHLSLSPRTPFFGGGSCSIFAKRVTGDSLNTTEKCAK